VSVAVQNLTFRYGADAPALRDVTLAVEPGELCAVIGPSGCGKSTLLKLVAGFLAPEAGRVAIGGKDAGSLPARRRELGVVFQSYALFPHMTALDNVAYPLRLRGVPGRERRRRARAALERARLGAFVDRYPGQLSGGQQQRVALARALVFQPRALLLDEPLSALDAAHRAAMRDEIRSIQREHGIATIHVTHDQEEALSIADRVAVLRDGRLLQHATPRELYDAPADRFVAGFVGHANLFEATVRSATHVETALGPLACAPHRFAAGEKVVAMFRPESVRLAGSTGVNRFEGRIVRDRFLGSLRRFDFAVERGIIVGETASREEVAVIEVPREQVKLLPHEGDRT
jgi:putative spermidine/putrescine transport system ATP-binding protein